MWQDPLLSQVGLLPIVTGSKAHVTGSTILSGGTFTKLTRPRAGLTGTTIVSDRNLYPQSQDPELSSCYRTLNNFPNMNMTQS